jgi:transcriptional regulator with GAF, ATPase, and Fis domain
VGAEPHELTLRLARELDPARTLELVLEALVAAAGAERGLAMRWDGRRFVGPAAERFSQTVLARLRRERRPLVYADAPAELARSKSIQEQRVRSVLAVPLLAADELIGAVYLDHADPNRFDAAALARVEALTAVAAVALDRARRVEESERARQQLRALHGRPPGFDALVGRSRPIAELLSTLDRMTDVDYPVLIEGESGTGKELVARALHARGRRAQGPFLPTNCGAMNETLLGSELFGHARGAFTGAERDRAGLFEAADGGTLFLDEIEAMSPAMQEALLRALESGEIRRVGENRARRVDVRVIGATNVALEVTDFRRDLFYRIAVLRLTLPPLRARCQDIPLLAEHFLGRIAEELNRPRATLEPEALRRLMDYAWPGNVRELQNALRRAAALSRDGAIRAQDLDFLQVPPPPPGGPVPLMNLDEYIVRAHAEWSGRLDDAEIAARLGISRKTLWSKRRGSPE